MILWRFKDIFNCVWTMEFFLDGTEPHLQKYFKLHMPIIPVLKRSKQEDCSWVQGHPGIDREFQANQICRVRPCLKQTKMANSNSTWQTVYDFMLQQKDRTQTGGSAPIPTTDIITLWKYQYSCGRNERQFLMFCMAYFLWLYFRVPLQFKNSLNRLEMEIR